jgi:acyl dehydratase
MSTEYFTLPEDFGFSARSLGRTITEGDFSLMTNLTWTTGEIHTNKVYIQEARGEDRILAGACVLAFALGLATPSIKSILVERGIRLIALVGYDNVRFRAPLHPGDTIYVEASFLSLMRTTRPDRAVVAFRDVVEDSTGRVIVEYERRALCNVADAAGLS